jgi:DUF438 domain-containing protein
LNTEVLTDEEEKQKTLKKIIKDLHTGMPGHPIHSFFQENREVKKILKSLVKIVKKMKKGDPKEKDAFQEEFRNLKKIDKHFVRKENPPAHN